MVRGMRALRDDAKIRCRAFCASLLRCVRKETAKHAAPMPECVRVSAMFSAQCNR